MDRCKFSVTVGNIGTVHTGDQYLPARRCFDAYVEQSKSGVGRAAGESIIFWRDGEPTKEHVGSLDMEEP